MSKNKKPYEKIRDLRESAGWSQWELARRCGIHQTTINNIERLKTIPSLRYAERIAKVFNVSLIDIMSNDNHHESVMEKSAIFFRKWGDIEKLNNSQKKILLSVIKLMDDGENK